jgi:hypothetical protein
VPVTQAAAADVAGWPVLGEPLWRWSGMRPGLVYPLQLGFVLLGTLGSCAVAWRISERDHAGRAPLAVGPWAVLLLALAALAVWILSQPMEMRGVRLGP